MSEGIGDDKSEKANDSFQAERDTGKIEIFVLLEIAIDNFREGLESFEKTKTESDGKFKGIVVFNKKIKERNNNHSGNGEDFGDEETFVADFGIFSDLENTAEIDTDVEY